MSLIRGGLMSLSEIGVFHLVRKGNGIKPLNRFLDLYAANPGDVEHDLIIIFKGFSPDDQELKDCKQILKGFSYKEIFIDDTGFDIGAYFKAYKEFAHSYSYFCFLNSYSILLDKEWLKKMYHHIKTEGIGLVGASGSHQSIYSVALRKLRPILNDNCLSRKRTSDTKKKSSDSGQLAPYGVYFDSFPSYHIRTNAFMVSHEVFNKIENPEINNKMDVWRFESGKNSLTNQVLNMNLDVLVIGKDGVAYKKEDWHKSNTFWHNDMGNLLVADNQTNGYLYGDSERKQYLYNHAWMNPRHWPSLNGDVIQNPCLRCGSKSILLFKSMDYNRRVTEEEFDYFKCSSCDFIFLVPIPENIGRYYPENYYYIPSSLGELAASAEQYEKYKIKIIQRFVEKGRLLEIGTATGGALYFAKQAGFEVEAIEMNHRCCEFLSNVIGVKTFKSDDACEVFKSSTTQYDVIALWHVIEHLPDYLEVLAAANEHLSPGGILVIAAPNPDSYQFKLFKKFWAHLDTPRHLVLIPLSILKQQMELLGMKTEWCTTTDDGGLMWNAFGWQCSLKNFLGNYIKDNTDLLKTSARFAPFLDKMFRIFERNWEEGCAYTVVFRKRKI